VRLKVRKCSLENSIISSSGNSPHPKTVFHLENAPGNVHSYRMSIEF